jgi:hypothetical protein
MTYQSYKHKVLSVGIATVAAYFGFQALDLISGIYQVHEYFAVAWYVALFHALWLAFIFDLHLKTGGHLANARQLHTGLAVFWHALANRAHHLYHWSYVRHYLNYLIMPTVMYWSVVILIYLNPFHELFKDGLIVASTLAMGLAYWHLKEAFSTKFEHTHLGLRALALVKLFAAYLAYTALMALGWYFGLNLFLVLGVVLLITFLLLYQGLFQHKLMRLEVYPLLVMFSLLIMLVFAVVFLKWNVNYYTAGVMVAVVYNTVWGLLHRYLDRTLTRKLLWEYVFMLIVLISLVLATHDFQGRI